MATNSILQDLYAQILHSEEQVKERNTKFKAVNEKIALIQAKTAELRDEIKSLQGNLAIQNNKVAEQELKLKWLEEREKVMNSQKQRLEETKLEIQNNLNSVQDERQHGREKFISDSEEFSSIYDLTGEGKRKRDAAKITNVQELLKNTEKLNSDIGAIQKEKIEIGVLENKKQQLFVGIKELELKHEEADKIIQTERDETERLRHEKQKLSEKLKTDSELQRLTTELKKSKEESLSLEGINDAMDQELNELRQQYYQKQLRKQREQREQQRHLQLKQHKIQQHQQPPQPLQHQQQQQPQQPQQQRQQQQQQKTQQQERREPKTQQRQLQHKPLTVTISRTKNLNTPSQRSVYFTQQMQDKKKQRPLFDESQNNQKQDESHGSTSNSAATLFGAERVKAFGKKPRFYY